MHDLHALRDSIREHLRNSGLPQQQLAQTLGVSQTWVSKFIRGDISAPRLDRLADLAKWVELDRKKGG